MRTLPPWKRRSDMEKFKAYKRFLCPTNLFFSSTSWFHRSSAVPHPGSRRG
uniref:Uncharacterized protein n=1 Tax=Arundo donax TaxID=35708 RepID=A0A0A9BQ31_ARUDO